MYANIQLLRAIAAILVLLHHASDHLAQIHNSSILKLIGSYGYLGVDLFFVISGFVISKSAHQHNPTLISLWNFSIKRIIRIYPSYWLALFAFCCLGWITGRDFSSVSWFETITLTSSNLFSNALPVSWSLTYELYFYALLIIAIATRKSGALLLIAMPILITLVQLLKWENISLFWLSPFVGEFLLGVLAFRCEKYLRRNLATTPLLSLMIFSFCLNLLQTLDPNIIFHRLIAGGGLGLSLVCMSIWAEGKPNLTANGYPIKLGDASYLIYLWHLFFIDFIYFTGIRGQLAYLGGWTGVSIFAGLSLMFLHVCIIAHLRIEAPINRFMVNMFLQTPRHRPARSAR